MGCYGEQDRLRRCLVLVFPIPWAKQVLSGKKFYSWKLFKQTICPWDGHRFSSRQEFPSVWAVLPCLFLRELVDSRTCVELYVEFSETRDFLTSVRQSRWSWGPLKISGNLLTHSYKGPGQKSWNIHSILPSTSYCCHVLISHLVPNSPPHVDHLWKKQGKLIVSSPHLIL